jgi:anti-anti-sigma factor
VTAILSPPTTSLSEIEIRLAQDLDISTLPLLQDQVDEALSQRPRRLVIDCSDCRYLDAQAIRVLVEARCVMRLSGGDLVLRGCTPDTTRLLGAVGVLQRFTLEHGTPPPAA